jgi:hypothetical protein
MASLGTFGAAKREYETPAEPDTFEFCGETYTVRGVIPTMLDLELAAGYAGKIGSVATNAAMFEALRIALTGPDEDDLAQWHQFRRAAIDNNVDDDEIARLTLTLCGWQIGVPTGQPSTSSDGQLPTSPSSNTSASASPDSPTSAPDGPDSAG